MIATTGWDGELASLIGVGLQDVSMWKEHAAEVMGFGTGGCGSGISFWGRGNVIVVGVDRWRGAFGGAQVLGFLILVAECSGNAGREMFGDKVDCQTGEGGKVTSTYCS